MSKFAKVCLGIAAVFAGIGVVLCGVGATFGATLGDVGNGARATHIGNLIGQFADMDGWNWDWNWNADDYDANDSSIVRNDYSYDKAKVKNLDIQVNAASLTIDKSSSDKVEVKVYLKNGDVSCGMDGDTLTIKDNTNHHYSNKHVEVQLLLPEGMELGDMNIDVSAGEVESSYGKLVADTATINVDAGDASIGDLQVKDELSATVGAGSIEMMDLEAKNVGLDCGVGEIDISGKVTGDITGDCGVGELSMKLDGEEEDYNYYIDCGIGEVDLGSHTYSSLGQEKNIDNDADKEMTLDCGIGSIAVEYQ